MTSETNAPSSSGAQKEAEPNAQALADFLVSTPQRHQRDGLGDILASLEDDPKNDAAERWTELLVQIHGLDVSLTLCKLASALSDESKQQLRARAERVVGVGANDRALRVSLKAVLAAAGETPDAEDARWLRQHLEVQRYIWPEKEEHAVVMRFSAYVLLKAGNKEEVTWACRVLEEGEIDGTQTAPPPIEAPEGVSLKPPSRSAFETPPLVESLTVSPDGTKLFAGGTGEVFDTETGQRLCVFDLQYSYIAAAAFTPDGTGVVVGLDHHENGAALFNADSGERLRDVGKHDDHVHCLALGEIKGKTHVVTADVGGHVCCTPLHKKRPIFSATIAGAATAVARIDSHWAVAYDWDTGKKPKPRLALFDDAGEELAILKSPLSIRAMSVAPDGRLALAGPAGLAITDPPTAKQKKLKVLSTIDVPDASSVCWGEGETLYATTKSGSLLHIVQGELVADHETGDVLHAVTASGDRAYAAGSLGQVVVLDGGKMRPRPAAHSHSIKSILQLSDGDLLTTDGRGNVLRHSAELTESRRWATVEDTIDNAALDGEFLFLGGRKGAHTIRTKDGSLSHSIACSDVRFISAANGMVAYRKEKNVQITRPDLEGGTVIKGIPRLGPLALVHGTDELLVGTDNGHIARFTTDGEELTVKVAHGLDRFRRDTRQIEVVSLLVSPNGETLATGSADGTVRLWDRVTLDPLLRIHRHFGYGDKLAFSPDSRWLAIPRASLLSIIDVQKRKLAWELPCPLEKDAICQASFVNGGLILGTKMGKLMRVDISSDALR